MLAETTVIVIFVSIRENFNFNQKHNLRFKSSSVVLDEFRKHGLLLAIGSTFKAVM